MLSGFGREHLWILEDHSDARAVRPDQSRISRPSSGFAPRPARKTAAEVQDGRLAAPIGRPATTSPGSTAGETPASASTSGRVGWRKRAGRCRRRAQRSTAGRSGVRSASALGSKTHAMAPDAASRTRIPSRSGSRARRNAPARGNQRTGRRLATNGGSRPSGAIRQASPNVNDTPLSSQPREFCGARRAARCRCGCQIAGFRPPPAKRRGRSMPASDCSTAPDSLSLLLHVGRRGLDAHAE